MGLLHPPISKYDNYFDRERFNLTWNVGMVIMIVFSFLTIYHVSTQDPNAIPSIVGFTTMVVCLINLKFTGRYFFSAITISVAATIVNQLDIYLLVNSQRLVDLLWIISAGLYAFYTLGNKIGILIMGLNLTGLIASIFILEKQVLIDAIANRKSVDQIDAVINLVVASGIIIYLIYKILRSNQLAQEKSRIVQEELIQKNEVVKAQSEEKTVMLREIHHRVKNNLQVITSLLRLQSREIKDVATAEHFREAINRVLTMALIHNKLYQSDDLSKVDVKGYLEDLSNDLIQSYSTEIPVDLSVETNAEHLVPKSLVSVGLLFNELISNSLKHGFRSVDHGLIRIVIHAPDEDTIEMFYSDNGVWLEPRKEESFGLELIDTLTAQLVGKYERSIEEGTHYHFTFEIEK